MVMMIAGDLLQHSRILVATNKSIKQLETRDKKILEQIFTSYMECELSRHQFPIKRWNFI